MSDYYNGSKLLSLKDKDKKTPEIFISTSNRSAGKTTFFGKYVMDHFLKGKGKFILLYRYAYELNDVADKFFTDIHNLFFPNLIMSQKMREKDTFAELFIQDVKSDEEVACAYAIPINKADNIKKCSHLLSDASIMLFDEFQPESGQYCTNEIAKFQSIHTSLARGNGEQVKYLPIIMISNFVSLLNPYYTALHIAERLQANTNYLRGEGWVLEQGFNDTASKAQKESAFNRAFGDTSYNKFSSEVFYLNDNNTFVKKMTGKSQYIFSLHYEDQWFGVRYFADTGVVYINRSPDMTHNRKYAVGVNDMTEDCVLFNRFDQRIMMLRQYFDRGAFRFADLPSKGAAFAMLSY